ncbi:MAG TPA: GNAT family N-acetyltransferase [Candidatus Sulfotelmatobacter sp.]|nr:GNAT family N-acetyltransferase [Candidatus Sulfotelmatobacter sp.]
MAVTYIETRIRGKNFQVPAAEIEGRTALVKGRWFKVASVCDEEVTEGELVANPAQFVVGMKRSGLKADVLTFFQRPPDVTPKFPYRIEWENYAVVPITTFEAWWEKLPQETRKNTRRAGKRGVVVKAVAFDDELARGIHKVCNEAPVRQGRRFWHYGKDVEAIRRENATYLERSEFIGAYFEGELIGYIKMVYVDKIAFILAVLALNAHQDKRPINALLTKAVEICAQKGVAYLVYGNYIYGNRKECSLVEFKRRNGFERIDFPRYYLPLTLKGHLFVALKLHRGPVGLLPGPLLKLLLKVRAFYLELGARQVAAQDG